MTALSEIRRRIGRATLRYRATWPPTIHPPEVPMIEPGATIGPPTFIGIGAPRSGSTWWFRQLQRHPQIATPSKELHWFDWFATSAFTDADCTAYHRYFPRREGQICGEWTPGYLYLPWAPALKCRAAPDAKLLVILRDPLEQIESSINYSRSMHGAPANPLMMSRHLNEGNYFGHLEHWQRHDPAELLVLQFEQCREEPRKQLDRTLDFLGVESDGSRIMQGTNAGAARSIVLTDRTRRAIAERLAPDVAALSARHPEIDVDRWPNFSGLV